MSINETIKTISYYDTNAQSFTRATQHLVFRTVQDEFLSYLPSHAKILDFGCGAGRDTKYFLEKGYEVNPVDGSKEMCLYTEQYTGLNVKQMLFTDLKEVDRYDGVWACSSILHLPYDELKKVLVLIARALKQEGYLYTSFKYGEFEGERNGRYFIDMKEERFKKMLEEIDVFTTVALDVTTDIRSERSEQKWLNVIVKKKNK